MTNLFPYHLFAHQAGRYQTVQALGLSDRESKALEQFFFGQTNDPAYLSSLANDPGIIWRAVMGRLALTRVRQGAKDQEGRATLVFESIVLSTEQALAATLRFPELVLGNWTKSTDGVSVSAPPPSANAGDLHPEKVSELLLSIQDGQRVVRRADSFSLRDLGKIIARHAREDSFSVCYKSLNPTAPVTVNLVSLGVAEANMTDNRPSTTAKRPLGQQSLVTSNAESGSLGFPAIAIYIALIIQMVMFWMVARVPARTSSSDEMQTHILSRIEKSDTDQDKRLNDLGLNLDKRFSSFKTEIESNVAQFAKEINEAAKENKAAIEGLAKNEEKSKDDLDKKWTTLVGSIDNLGQSLDSMKKDLQQVAQSMAALRTMMEEQAKPQQPEATAPSKPQDKKQ